jgi:uncharacterized membrane protein
LNKILYILVVPEGGDCLFKIAYANDDSLVIAIVFPTIFGTLIAIALLVFLCWLLVRRYNAYIDNRSSQAKIRNTDKPIAVNYTTVVLDNTKSLTDDDTTHDQKSVFVTSTNA